MAGVYFAYLETFLPPPKGKIVRFRNFKTNSIVTSPGIVLPAVGALLIIFALGRLFL
jgi:hypothetical protein